MLGAAHKPGAMPLRPLGLGDFYDAAFRIIRFNPKATVGAAVLVAAVAMAIPVLATAVLSGAADLTLDDGLRRRQLDRDRRPAHGRRRLRPGRPPAVRRHDLRDRDDRPRDRRRRDRPAAVAGRGLGGDPGITVAADRTDPPHRTDLDRAPRRVRRSVRPRHLAGLVLGRRPGVVPGDRSTARRAPVVALDPGDLPAGPGPGDRAHRRLRRHRPWLPPDAAAVLADLRHRAADRDRHLGRRPDPHRPLRYRRPGRRACDVRLRRCGPRARRPQRPRLGPVDGLRGARSRRR